MGFYKVESPHAAQEHYYRTKSFKRKAPASERGLRIVRFRNDEVKKDLMAVIARIQALIPF